MFPSQQLKGMYIVLTSATQMLRLEQYREN